MVNKGRAGLQRETGLLIRSRQIYAYPCVAVDALRVVVDENNVLKVRGALAGIGNE